jgi:hypothetical protein
LPELPSISQSWATESGSGSDPDPQLPQGMREANAVAAGMGKDGNPVITVTATDGTCLPDLTTMPAGVVWIKLVNNGAKVNEMYLETDNGRELVVVANIRHGETGAFKTTLEVIRQYLIACEPGMAGRQIRTPLTVISDV